MPRRTVKPQWVGDEIDESQFTKSSLTETTDSGTGNDKEHLCESSPPGISRDNEPAAQQEDVFQRLRDLLLQHASPVGPTSSQQRMNLTLEQLEVRNTEISIEMEEMSLEYDFLQENNQDHYRDEILAEIDEKLDALAEESDEIEQIMELNYRVVGGGRVLFHSMIKTAAEHAASLVTPSIQVTSSSRVIQDQQWETKFEEAYQSKKGPQLFETPLLKRLNQYYEEQMGDYDSKIRKRSEIEGSDFAPQQSAKKQKGRQSLQFLDEGISSYFDYDLHIGSFTQTFQLELNDVDVISSSILTLKSQEKSSVPVYIECDYSDELEAIPYLIFVFSEEDISRHESHEFAVPFPPDSLIGWIASRVNEVSVSNLASFDMFSTIGDCFVYGSLLDVEVSIQFDVSIPSIIFDSSLFSYKASPDILHGLDFILSSCSDPRFLDGFNPEKCDKSILDVAELYESIRPTWTEFKETPSSMKSKLSNYQKKALSWMIFRENADGRTLQHNFTRMYRFDSMTIWLDFTQGVLLHSSPEAIPDIAGGILAEEMGLGKSVEVISLITTNRREIWNNSSFKDSNMSFFDLRSTTFYDVDVMFRCSELEDCNLVRNIQYVPKTSVFLETAATLIVAPANILLQWRSEILKHAPHLSVILYEGIKTFNVKAEDMASYDVVLTTYDTLKQDIFYSSSCNYSFRGAREVDFPCSPLIQLNWWRLVMDEAQFIESPATNTARMASKISAINRWCVTGTPIGKNGLDDLYGLMLFLQFSPFSNRSVWKRCVEETYKRGRSGDLVCLLRSIMWRHCKHHVEHELTLPPLITHVVYQEFSPIEEEYYKRLVLECKADLLRNHSQDDQTVRWYQIEKLRQACCHPQISKEQSKQILGLCLQNSEMSMNQIMKLMLERSEDEFSGAERELCRSLNRLALFHRRFGDHKACEHALIEAWRIEDGGLDYESRLPDESRRNNSLFITPSRNFKNDQVRMWRMIDYLTISTLKNLYADSTIVLSTPDEIRLQNIRILEKQLSEARDEILDLDLKKVRDRKILIGRYHDLMFEFSKNSLESARIIHQKYIDNPEMFIFNHQDELAELEDRLLAERRDLDFIYSFYSLYRSLFIVEDFYKTCESNFSVMEHKRQVLTSLKAIFAEHSRFEFSRIDAPAGSAIVSSHKMSSLIRGSPNDIITKFKKNYATIKQEIAKTCRNYERHNPGSKVLSKESSRDVYLEKFSHYKKKWEIVSDSLSLLRILKRMHLEKNLLVENELNLSHQINALEESCKIPEFLDEEKGDLYSAITNQVHYCRQIAFSRFRHIAHLKNKFSLLMNSAISDVKNVAYIDSNFCAICQNPALRPVLTTCCHLFCLDCISKWLRTSNLNQCAVCRGSLSDQSLFPLGEALTAQGNHAATGVAEIDCIKIKNEGEYGTKIESIVKHMLYLAQNQKSGSCSPQKALVFSQYPPMLELVGKALAANDVQFLSLSGTSRNRAKIVEQFYSDDSIRVMLLGLRKDSSGLTLVSAQHVFLLEPSLNPSVEEQAINRVYRRGQVDNVHVWKFIMKNSIEEKIVEIQHQKRRLGSNHLRQGSLKVGGAGAEAVLAHHKESQFYNLDDLNSLFHIESNSPSLSVDV